MHRSVPILSIVTWLGGILLVWRGPFTSIEGLRLGFNFLSYFVCGIIFATAAGIGEFRWARLVSFALSVPAAIFGCLEFFGTLMVCSLHLTTVGFRTLFYVSVYLTIDLLMISMPVFWVVLCAKLPTRALTNR